jgi:hypothetical protein
LGNKDLRGLLESEIEALRKNYERMAVTLLHLPNG